MKISLQNMYPENPEKLPTVQKLWHLKPKLRFLQWLRVLWKVVKDLFFKDIWPQVNLYEVQYTYFCTLQKNAACFSIKIFSFQQICFCCASKGYTPKIKRNDFMGICNGRKNSLWWNDANVGGCPLTSGSSMSFYLNFISKCGYGEFLKKISIKSA